MLRLLAVLHSVRLVPQDLNQCPFVLGLEDHQRWAALAAEEEWQMGSSPAPGRSNAARAVWPRVAGTGATIY